MRNGCFKIDLGLQSESPLQCLFGVGTWARHSLSFFPAGTRVPRLIFLQRARACSDLFSGGKTVFLDVFCSIFGGFGEFLGGEAVDYLGACPQEGDGRVKNDLLAKNT